MTKPARKFILIPEYRPLYAMAECFGPKHGPLTEPCPTPLTVIRKLLLQQGDEALTIMEVLRNIDGTTTSPVRLTLENYTLPYKEILGGKKMPDKVIVTEPPVEDGVGPVVVQRENKEDKIKTPVEPDVPPVEVQVETEEAYQEPTEEETDMIPDNDKQPEYVTSGYIASANPEPEPDGVVTISTPGGTTIDAATIPVDPYAGMSKAERKAARRAAREAGGIVGSTNAAPIITNQYNCGSVDDSPQAGGIAGFDADAENQNQ